MGLLQSIFGKTKKPPEDSSSAFKLLNSYTSAFTPFSGAEWDISIVRAAVHAFARHAAKVSPQHIRRHDGTYTVEERYSPVLRSRPNPYMSAYAMYYKIAVNYKLTNNAFIFPVWEEDRLTALYPVMAQKIELVESKGEMYCNFKFNPGASYYFPYSEIIHIRNHFYDNDIFGSANSALHPVLSTANTFNQSMSKFAEQIAIIRGILKVPTASKDEDLKLQRDNFIRDNLSIANNGSGIIVSSAKSEYVPVTDKSTPIPAAQLKYIKDEIYDYIGVNENIVQNKFTEEEWNSFYNGEIEPFYVQLSQAMTNCLFSERERGFGNEIIAAADQLNYASVETKIEASRFLTNIGAATLDQILEIFHLPPIGGEEGQRRVQTLNMANAAIVDSYQLGKNEEEGNPSKEGGGENGGTANKD